MRKVAVVLLAGVALSAGACGADPDGRAVDACALVDPDLAASLVGDRTGEPVESSRRAYSACMWEGGDELDSDRLTVDAATYDRDDGEAASRDYRYLSTTWKCTAAVTVQKAAGSSACRYQAELNTGIVLNHHGTVARIAYRGPKTPQHDPARQAAIADQLAARAFSVL
ncbi:hypothetical protein [Actinomadura litoris]|uniref:DUF3558 domain-containing protein n=1 Tax=Actinomadura litoris TaxID=2678616 RepID=A0A7K1L2T0_9ACTN|nr:hypothetical protein [Actinomadura litoris]MUN38712.1 hypothetical protein [Actinomadura litoris]